MNKWMAVLALTLAPTLASATISYEGSLDDGEVQTGELPVESGWIQSNGAAVDFWSFDGSEGESISLWAQSSVTDIAFSIYTGTPDEVSQPFWFDNSSDWDLFEFVTLSSTEGDESLLDFILPSTGMFTLAIGGEVPDFLAEQGQFAYSLGLERQAVDVPVPGVGWLMLSGLAGLVVARRRTV